MNRLLACLAIVVASGCCCAPTPQMASKPKKTDTEFKAECAELVKAHLKQFLGEQQGEWEIRVLLVSRNRDGSETWKAIGSLSRAEHRMMRWEAGFDQEENGSPSLIILTVDDEIVAKRSPAGT
jgi:hypothetical protein